ncbi:MAG TPA: radical SAM protein [candidate division Zixibacteria bacterium]|nr:radical SAM protein [candidate division Zixibacteria bacterium]
MRPHSEILRSELSPFDARPMGWSQLMAWVFANSYETAMSNIGYQWLFGILRERGDILVERFFAGDATSLESDRPLREFPTIALSLPYELDILNFLSMLKSAAIPLFARERENAPIIIAGGDAITLNPFPFADFFDILILGCGEAWGRRFPEIMRNMPPGMADRDLILNAAQDIPGAWVFSRGVLGQIGRAPATREFPAFTPILTSFGHFRNMFLAEIQRSCPFSCGFCSSRWLSQPFVNYSAESILEVYRERGQGAGRVGLVGSAVAEHPELARIIDGFSGLGARVSPSSIRFDRIDDATLAKLADAGIRSLTFAPEIASEHLGRNIGKWIPPASIVEYAAKAEKTGFRELKLYWIIGLPDECDDDIIAIAEAIKKIASASSIALSCSVNAFTPKPHSAFEREPMADDNTLKRKFALLKSSVAGCAVKLDLNYSRQSRIAALLSICGRELAPILAKIANGENIKKALREGGIDITAEISAGEEPEWGMVQ